MVEYTYFIYTLRSIVLPNLDLERNYLIIPPYATVIEWVHFYVTWSSTPAKVEAP